MEYLFSRAARFKKPFVGLMGFLEIASTLYAESVSAETFLRLGFLTWFEAYLLLQMLYMRPSTFSLDADQFLAPSSCKHKEKPEYGPIMWFSRVGVGEDANDYLGVKYFHACFKGQSYAQMYFYGHNLHFIISSEWNCIRWLLPPQKQMESFIIATKYSWDGNGEKRERLKAQEHSTQVG